MKLFDKVISQEQRLRFFDEIEWERERDILQICKQNAVKFFHRKLILCKHVSTNSLMMKVLSDARKMSDLVCRLEFVVDFEAVLFQIFN